MSVLLMVELKIPNLSSSSKLSFMIIGQFVPITLSEVIDTTESSAACYCTVSERGTYGTDDVFQGVHREGSAGLRPEVSRHCCVC
jgi:hypothetical protein